jgi:hypothetical protein
VIYEDARESLEARHALDQTFRSATRWIAESLPEGDRRALGAALEAGARLRVEILLPNGDARVTLEVNGERREFMRVEHRRRDA